MTFTLILCTAQNFGAQLIRAFSSNYPNYTIHFVFSKGIPGKTWPDIPADVENQRESSSPIFLCDNDEGIGCLRRTFPTIPVIAVSHKHNSLESLMGTPWLILSPDALTPFFLEEVYCRSHKKPLTIARTARCILRELIPADLPGLLQLQSENASNPDGCFFPAGCPNPDAFLLDYIQTQYPFFGFGMFGVIKKEDDVFLGIVGLLAEEDTAAISYSLLKQHQHKGMATEAVRGLLAAAKLRWDFTDFTAIIHRNNTPSARTAKRCGLHIRLYDIP